MTNESTEFLRYNLYIIVGLLAGLSIGIGVGPQFRDFVINKRWPKESIDAVAWSLFFVSILLNFYLYRGLQKGDHRESVTNSSPQSQSR
jgi:hypothetical protein